MARKPAVAAMPDGAKLELIQQTIKSWRQAQLEVAKAAKREKDLRSTLVELGFSNVCHNEGAQPLLPVGYGHLKFTGKFNRSVDEAALLAYRQTLNPQNPEHAEALEIYSNMFAWKPSLVVSVWKAQTASVRNIFADVVTEKEGTPALEFVLPEQK
jgi:hypothetical protein